MCREGEFPAESSIKEGKFAGEQKRFGVEQIATALKQAESRVPLVERIRRKNALVFA
jgi:hypothetical protein